MEVVYRRILFRLVQNTLPNANQFPVLTYKKSVAEEDNVDYIQLDDRTYSYLIDPKWREYVRNEMSKKP